METLWRLANADGDAEAPFERTSSGLALVLDRLLRSSYGARQTRDDAAGAHDAHGRLAAECAWLLLWLVAASERHLACLSRTRLKRDSGGLVAECVAALDAGRNGAVAGAALFALAKISAESAASRPDIARASGRLLADLVDGDRGARHRTEALRVLLNVSVEAAAVKHIARENLRPLVSVATASYDEIDAETREFACSVLANVSRDEYARQIIYLQKLRLGFAPARVARGSLDEPTTSTASAGGSPGASPLRSLRSPEVLRTRRGGLDDRRTEKASGVPYAEWLRASFPAEAHRLSSKKPPTGSRALSEHFAKFPGRAQTLWNRAPETLWNPAIAATPPEIFYVRALHDTTARQWHVEDAIAIPPKGGEITRPRPGSHRIGPCGALGSIGTRNGEDPWAPLVAAATTADPDEAAQTAGSGASVEAAEKTCVLAPGGARNTFRFRDGEAGGVFWDLRRRSDAHLCAFKHVPGSKIGDMFPSYAFAEGHPDGEDAEQRYHLYHSSRLTSEVFEPGDWPPPPAPPFWDDGDGAFLELQPLDVPACDPLPEGALPPLDPPRCPTTSKHFLPHLKTLSLLGNSKLPWGQLPRHSLHLLAVRRAAKAAPVVKRAAVARKADPREWKLEDSIFAPRLRECDARAFHNEAKVHAKMMAHDFGTLEKMPRYPKFLARLAGSQTQGAGAAPLEAAIKRSLFPMFRILCQCMDYYGYKSTNDDPFDLAANSFNLFLKDANILDKKLTSEVAQRIFVQVNVEIGGDKTHNAKNDDNALMRHEFVEAVLRLTAAKYDLEKRAAESPSSACEIIEDALHSTLRDHLLHLPHESLHDNDDFRRRRLYDERVDLALCAHKKILRDLYDAYATMKPIAGRPTLRPAEWFLFLETAGLISSCTSRDDALKAYIFSRMRFVDETRAAFRCLSWVSFLEAIVRVADQTAVPSAASMRSHGATQLSEFYEALAARCELGGKDAVAEVRIHLTPDHGRSLGDKVALVLSHVLQNHAIKHQCWFKTKTKTVGLRAYLSEDEKDRWLSAATTKTRRVDVEGLANEADRRPRSRNSSPVPG